jgi:hypothetical protein
MNNTKTMCSLPNLAACDLSQTKLTKNEKVNLNNNALEIFVEAEIELAK